MILFFSKQEIVHCDDVRCKIERNTDVDDMLARKLGKTIWKKERKKI